MTSVQSTWKPSPFSMTNHLYYEAESAGKFNEGIHNNYMSYLKGGSTGREIQQLQDITNLSNSKAQESEQGMLNEEKKNTIAKRNMLGRAVWDDVFEEDNPELPSTRFMKKVKQAVTKNDYQQLTKKILNELQDKKDQFCKSTYPELKEARSKLYTMMTEIIVQETEI